LWEIAKPLTPPSRVRSLGGGTQDTPDETLFAAIVRVLESGCAWRAFPPCFGISKSTAHRRFLIWSRAGVWGRLHEAVVHRLGDAGLVDVTRVVLDSVLGLVSALAGLIVPTVVTPVDAAGVR
jgi:transposase